MLRKLLIVSLLCCLTIFAQEVVPQAKENKVKLSLEIKNSKLNIGQVTDLKISGTSPKRIFYLYVYWGNPIFRFKPVLVYFDEDTRAQLGPEKIQLTDPVSITAYSHEGTYPIQIIAADERGNYLARALGTIEVGEPHSNTLDEIVYDDFTAYYKNRPRDDERLYITVGNTMPGARVTVRFSREHPDIEHPTAFGEPLVIEALAKCPTLHEGVLEHGLGNRPTFAKIESRNVEGQLVSVPVIRKIDPNPNSLSQKVFESFSWRNHP